MLTRYQYWDFLKVREYMKNLLFYEKKLSTENDEDTTELCLTEIKDLKKELLALTGNERGFLDPIFDQFKKEIREIFQDVK